MSSKIRIFTATSETQIPDDNNQKSLLPSLKSAFQAASIEIQEVQLEHTSGSMLELINSLKSVVAEIKNSADDDAKVSRISFSLGMNSDGEVGILGLFSATVTHVASVTVEFDLF